MTFDTTEDSTFPIGVPTIEGRGRPGFTPADLASIESLQKWAAEQRAGFGTDRSKFNFTVCAALAAAGLAPTASLVLRVGRWGTTSSVQADTRDWYQALGQRLRNMEAAIPLPARQQANALVEQLFSLATRTAQNSLAERLAPMEQQIDTLKLQCSQLASEKAELGLQLTAALSDAEQAKTSLLAATTERDALQEKLLLQDRLHVREKAAHIEQTKALQLEAQNLRQAMAEAQTQHARALLDANVAAEAERRRLMLTIDSERVDATKRLDKVSSELSEARGKLDASRLELSQVAMSEASLKASLAGTHELLAIQRNQTESMQQRLNSDEFRAALLLDFLARGEKAGFKIAIPTKNIERAAGWLQSNLKVTQDTAKRVLESVASGIEQM